jgi:hypothetical protein
MLDVDIQGSRKLPLKGSENSIHGHIFAAKNKARQDRLTGFRLGGDQIARKLWPQAIALTRADRRETLREAVFL